ncbi:MAG: poly-gamma-glutamate hydrolase family protein, partial [Thermodesulfobacteriota bacterium]|nr:poly-gamma-glutamate hydrolase family protein [Thermodesulfobacteriota bacterium]
MDKYETYAELKKSEIEDKDYTVLYRNLSSRIVVMAPHGGGIEPGTIDIADELAGCEYTFYGFKGLKKDQNSTLHLNSNTFDEPIGAKVADKAEIVISIHGAKDKSEMVHIGGANNELKRVVTNTLKSAGFNAEICGRPGLRGIQPENICNRC